MDLSIKMAAFAKKYPLPAALATSFSPSEIQEIRAAFASMDTNGDGTIDSSELATIFAKIGEKVKPEDIPTLLGEMDRNNDQKVDFEEFVTLINEVRQGNKKTTVMGGMLRKSVGFLTVEGEGGGTHSFSEEEKVFIYLTP